MRFDLERALAFLNHFDTLRLPGSVAEREAAEVVANEFAKAGLDVRRGEVPGLISRDATAGEVWAMATLAIAAGVALQWTAGSGPGRSTPWMLATVFCGLAIAGVVLRLLVNGRRPGTPVRAPYVVAQTPAENHPSSRVVVLSHLDTRPPIVTWRFRRDLALLDVIWLAALWLPCLLVGGWPWLTTAGPALLIGLGVITLLRRVEPWTRHPEPYPADNRTGLALLIELARSWPHTPSRNVQTVFVASSSPAATWGPELRAALLRSGSRPDAPTFLINLEAPGLGDRITIAGRGESLRHAETAARDLWLPAQFGGWPSFPLDHRPLARVAEGAVSLVGVLDSENVDPKRIGATAQLAQEIALRWAARWSPEPAEESPGA